MTTLHTKYRPKTFDAVVGNETTVQSVVSHLSAGTQRSFIFYGPPGTGKTTLARLIQEHVGAVDIDCVEFNAGADTGIDAIRSLLEMTVYQGFGPIGSKVFILDEAHMLTRNSWNALLKIVEEPPEWLYWCFCTTEISKIPKSILSRCAIYEMEKLDTAVIVGCLGQIADLEGWHIKNEILEAIAQECGGSLRNAITAMGDIHVLGDHVDEARAMISGVVAADELTVIDFCRKLTRASGFAELQPCLAGMAAVGNSEGLRRVIVAYFAKVAIGARDRRGFERAACVLDAFGAPYCGDAGVGPLVVSTRNFLVAARG